MVAVYPVFVLCVDHRGFYFNYAAGLSTVGAIET